jgi:DNA polymerase (family 10)
VSTTTRSHCNRQVAALFRSIADRLAAQQANPYRVNAYRKAADAVDALWADIADVAARQALEDIPGIGLSLADKIEEFLRTGTITVEVPFGSPPPKE